MCGGWVRSDSFVVGMRVLCVAFGVVGIAEAQREWPFDIPRHSQLPAVESIDWGRNPIDTFVLAKLEQQGISPAPEASARTLVRRLYFDLIGLPPSPEEVEAFVNDLDPLAHERLVDRLLADPRYGERWARRWLDLARYADTAGYEGDPDLPHAWRYRDYVIDAWNDDKPYDLFIREQIAGDEFKQIMGAGELPLAPPERVVALTFLRLAPFTEPRGDETRHEMLSEITSTVGSVFLGLTVGCAKCHDHKYDEIPISDFYRMKAFFATIQIQPPERGDAYQIGGPLPAAFYRHGEQSWAQQMRRTLDDDLVVAKAELARLKTELKATVGDDYPSVLDDASDDRISPQQRARFVWLRSRDRFIRQHQKRLLPVAMSLRHSIGPPFEPGVPTSRVMLRGEYDNPGGVVEPGFLSCVTGHVQPAEIPLDPFKRWPTRSRRLVLANWIADESNPLTARVMVNRLWHWHFGSGIVPTPSDFGQLSDGPSHRELLDWLALTFVKSGWSIKQMHRLICNSATYRQRSNHVNPDAAAADPTNRLLWRFNRRRLDAEVIRDALLAVSGRLTNESHGLPVFPPLPGGIAEAVKYDNSKWDTQHGPAGRKRSVYIYQQRTLTMPFMQTFDAIVCDESRPRRGTSVTPLQALAMYNGEFVNEEASHFACRVRQDVGEEPEAQVRRAFKLALGRSPLDDEVGRVLASLRLGATGFDLDGACRVLLNTNEFVYVD